MLFKCITFYSVTILFILFLSLFLSTLFLPVDRLFYNALVLMTTLTTSPVMVALVQTASTLPVFLLGVPSGAMADIVDRRRYFAATQLWVSINALLLAALSLAGLLTAEMLLLLTFTNGIGLALRWPVFAAIVPQVVPRAQLPQALALNGIAMNLSRVVGPVVAGVLLSSISHDLRSPLAALQASVEAVRDGVAPDPDRYLAAMERHVAAMGMLIDDLFLHSRLAAGAVPMAADVFDVGELVHQSAEMIRPVAAAQDVEVTVDAPSCSLVGDAPQLGRVIRNLLDNAVRHAAMTSGHRRVIACVASSATDVTVRVQDSGPGFPTEFGACAFEPFTRADPARDRNAGTAGLGLSIAREIVRLHQGSIEILSGPGGHLIVRLPRRPV